MNRNIAPKKAHLIKIVLFSLNLLSYSLSIKKILIKTIEKLIKLGDINGHKTRTFTKILKYILQLPKHFPSFSFWFSVLNSVISEELI